MSRALKVGLSGTAVGLVGVFASGPGICGPTAPAGEYLFLGGIYCLAAGIAVCVGAALRAAIRLIRR